VSNWPDEWAKVVAERDRLRAALEQIAGECADMTNQQIYDFAKAALTPAHPSPHGARHDG
jgi:hypothetical protein